MLGPKICYTLKIWQKKGCLKELRFQSKLSEIASSSVGIVDTHAKEFLRKLSATLRMFAWSVCPMLSSLKNNCFKRHVIIRRQGPRQVSGRPCISNSLFNIRAYSLYSLWGKSSIPPLGHIESPSPWVLGAFSPGRKTEQTEPHSVQVKNSWN